MMPQAQRLRKTIEVQPIGADHLQTVAEVHCAAFPDSALSTLGTEAVRRYYEWQLSGAHDSVALGAFVEGEVGGFCVGGVFRGKMSGYLRQNRWFLISRLARHPWLIARTSFRARLVSALRILKLLPQPKNAVALYRDSDPTSFGILAIAVHPRSQGLGVGRVLMAEAEAIARRRGFRAMNLSVHVTNQQAIRFYEGLEWQRRPAPNSVWQGEMTKCLNG
ncbi:MAG: GNAT family N-acetyltransferase [Vicinamibacterales bacterium]